MTVPFFAIEANELLLSGSYDEVISTCLSNLNNYSYYPSCYILLIKASILSNDFEIAKKYLAIACELFPNLTIFHILNKELNKILENHSIYENLNFIELDNNSTNKHLDSESSIEKDYNNIEKPEQINYSHSRIVIMDFEDENNSTITEAEVMNELVDNSEVELKTLNSFQIKNLKSSNIGKRSQLLNSIPGLILSPLKLAQKSKGTENHIKPLPPFPPFPKYIEDIHRRELNTTIYPLSDQDFTSFAKEVINYNKESSIEDSQSNKPIEDEESKIEITETYANILYQQKAYKEALEIYKNLLERNPEKEDLKKKIEDIEFILSSNT